MGLLLGSASRSLGFPRTFVKISHLCNGIEHRWLKFWLVMIDVKDEWRITYDAKEEWKKNSGKAPYLL